MTLTRLSHPKNIFLELLDLLDLRVIYSAMGAFETVAILQ